MENKTYGATREDLMAVPTPEQTTTYKPVTHQELMNITENCIKKAGFEIRSMHFNSARHGQVVTAHYTIESLHDDEMRLMVSWQNSYDKSVTLKFALGVHVFICANGMVVGDMGTIRRKHTGEIQSFTPAAIASYISTAGAYFENIQKQREMMKGIQVDTRKAAELIGRMLIERKFINPTQMNIIIRELNHPTLDYRAPGSLWELYQFTTYAMKITHPESWMQSHMLAHEFFLEEMYDGQYGEEVMTVEEAREMYASNQMSIFDVIEHSEQQVAIPNEIVEELLNSNEPESFLERTSRDVEEFLAAEATGDDDEQDDDDFDPEDIKVDFRAGMKKFRARLVIDDPDDLLTAKTEKVPISSISGTLPSGEKVVMYGATESIERIKEAAFNQEMEDQIQDSKELIETIEKYDVTPEKLKEVLNMETPHLEFDKEEPFVQAGEKQPNQDITVKVSPFPNHSVRIESLDADGHVQVYHFQVEGDDEDDAQRIATNVFEFDYPLQPIDDITVTYLK